jgi:NAD(P)H dehydrogenase (quinone)
MKQRILVILGHPSAATFNGALAQAYARAAEASGAAVRIMNIGELKFDPILHQGYKVIQDLEPDLLKFQENVRWADHLVWVYPDWWGSMPALLKGLIDRALLPGFGFKYPDPGLSFPAQLLKGRSARLIVSMDAPPWYYRWLIGAPGHLMMRRAILGFCGVSPIRVTSIGPMKIATELDRQRWLKQVAHLGAKRA